MGWTTEYTGHAVSTDTSDVVCLDHKQAAEINWKSYLGCDLRLAQVNCPSSISECYDYPTYESVACVVCTK